MSLIEPGSSSSPGDGSGVRPGKPAVAPESVEEGSVVARRRQAAVEDYSGSESQRLSGGAGSSVVPVVSISLPVSWRFFFFPDPYGGRFLFRSRVWRAMRVEYCRL